MSDLDLTAYKDLYLKTAREHLSDLKNNLALLDSNPADKKAVYEIFRMFHSLKSQNIFMGYRNTAGLCKLFEDYFRSINEGNKKFNTGISATISGVLEKLEMSLKSIEQNNQETELETDIKNYENQIVNL